MKRFSDQDYLLVCVWWQKKNPCLLISRKFPSKSLAGEMRYIFLIASVLLRQLRKPCFLWLPPPPIIGGDGAKGRQNGSNSSGQDLNYAITTVWNPLQNAR